MIKFDFKKYTGRNVRIVVLDSGYADNIYCLEKDGGQIINRGNVISNQHLINCIETIKLSAPDAEVIAINIGQESGMITEDSVIQGIKTAIDLMPKIIVASFSFAYVSNDFISVINSAIDRGIIICASVDPVVKNSYPQTINGVISVDELKTNCAIRPAKKALAKLLP